MPTQHLCHTRRVGRASLCEVAKLTTHDFFRYALHRGDDIAEQLPFLTNTH